MIVGFGNDLCDIRRIERALSRYDKRFTHRLFTDVERKNQISGLDARPHTLSVLPQRGVRKSVGNGHQRRRFLERYGCSKSDFWPSNNSSDRPRSAKTSGNDACGDENGHSSYANRRVSFRASAGSH